MGVLRGCVTFAVRTAAAAAAVHSLKLAAAHLPRVDAIGGSSAGVYINNKVRVASLFRGVEEKRPELFDSKVKNMFLDVAKEWCVIVLFLEWCQQHTHAANAAATHAYQRQMMAHLTWTPLDCKPACAIGVCRLRCLTMAT